MTYQQTQLVQTGTTASGQPKYSAAPRQERIVTIAGRQYTETAARMKQAGMTSGYAGNLPKLDEKLLAQNPREYWKVQAEIKAATAKGRYSESPSYVTDVAMAGKVYEKTPSGTREVPLRPDLEKYREGIIREAQARQERTQATERKNYIENYSREEQQRIFKLQEAKKTEIGADYFLKLRGYEKRIPSEAEQKQMQTTIGVPVYMTRQTFSQGLPKEERDKSLKGATEAIIKTIQNARHAKMASLGKIAWEQTPIIAKEYGTAAKESVSSIGRGVSAILQPNQQALLSGKPSEIITESFPVTKYLKLSKTNPDVANLGTTIGIGVVLTAAPYLTVPAATFFVGKSVVEERPIGETLFTASLFALPELGSKAKAERVIKAAEKKPVLDFEFQEIREPRSRAKTAEIKGQVQYISGQGETSGIFKPEYPSTTYKFYLPKKEPTISYRSIVPVKIKNPNIKYSDELLGVITPKGKEYQLRAVSKGSKDYFIKTVTEKGKAETTVYLKTKTGVKELATFRGKTEAPQYNVQVMERLFQAKNKQYASYPELRIEDTKKISKQNLRITSSEPQKFFKSTIRPKGDVSAGVVRIDEKLLAATKIRGYTKTLYKPFEISPEGGMKPSGVELEVTPTKYRFSKFYKKPESVVITETPEAIRIRQPATTHVEEQIGAIRKYTLKLEKQKPKLQENIESFISDIKKRNIIKNKKAEVAEQTNVFERILERPKRAEFKYGEASFSIGKAVREPVIKTESFSGLKQNLEPRISAKAQTRLGIKPLILSKTETRSTPRIEVKPLVETKIEPKLEFKPMLEAKTELRTEPKVETKTEARTMLETKLESKTEVRVIPAIKTQYTPEVTNVVLPPITPITLPSSPTLKLKFRKLTKRHKKGFAAFLKKKGKDVQVSPSTTREAALDIGTKASKGSLSATFKIKETGQPAIDIRTGGEFAKMGTTFRTYKIKKGQKVPLKDTFIEKRGTRLSTKAERTSIQRSRKKNNFFR